MLTPPYNIYTGDAPIGKIISSTTLEMHIKAHDVLAKAHEQAQAMMSEAQSLIDAAHIESQTIRLQAEREGIEAGKQEIAQAIETSITQTISWLAKHNAMEQMVIHKLEKRIRDYFTHAFVAFFAGCDRIELLMNRLLERLPEFIEEQRLTLRVHPEAKNKVAHQLADDHRIRILSDDALLPAQACLQSDWVEINIDIEQSAQVMQRALQECYFVDSKPEPGTALC